MVVLLGFPMIHLPFDSNSLVPLVSSCGRMRHPAYSRPVYAILPACQPLPCSLFQYLPGILPLSG
jgi:hypothetical protein